MIRSAGVVVHRQNALYSSRWLLGLGGRAFLASGSKIRTYLTDLKSLDVMI